jgi:hypothetical protein
MNPSTLDTVDTFATYQAARCLQDEAREVMNRLERLADHGVKKASKLLDAAWCRYNRRTYRVNMAEALHWGAI